MRTFSSYEKEILRFMVTGHRPQDVCTINLFDKFCDATLIEWSEDFSELHIYAKEVRSDFGADAFLELHSVVETAKKHNQTPFNAIQALFEV